MAQSEILKKLRERSALSQAEVSSQLGVSRPSYAAIERGEKELTISQLRTLADLYDVTPESLLRGAPVQKTFVHIAREKRQPAETIRINVPQRNAAKFREVLLYVLEQIGSRPNVGKAVLNKLLYFIDFDYYEKYEEQLVGAVYIKNTFGPTPVEFPKIVAGMVASGDLEEVKSRHFTREQTKYLPRRSPDLSVLSARELAHIDETLARLGGKNATELQEHSHRDVPWLTNEDGKPIDYESVFYRTPEFSVREYHAG